MAFLLSLSIAIAISTIRIGGLGPASGLPVESPPFNVVGSLQGKSQISGYIFDSSHRPVADVYVELLDDYYSTRGRVRTDGSGHYVFTRLTTGNYKVRVMPMGTDYLEQTQDVSLGNSVPTIGSSSTNTSAIDFVQVDFVLKPRGRGASRANSGVPGVIFAQEIPVEAKKAYEQALLDLEQKRQAEGLASLKKAIEIFPTYYLALQRLGTEYVKLGQYETARDVLTKAVEVNSRGQESLYALGVAQYYLRDLSKAAEALRRATTLAPNSVNSNFWLGIVLMRDGKLDEAESYLRNAYKFGGKQIPDVHMYLAQVYSNTKRYSQAADELELFLAEAPDATDSANIKELITKLREKARK
jgi:Flp pilus assembly protein TadD